MLQNIIFPLQVFGNSGFFLCKKNNFFLRQYIEWHLIWKQKAVHEKPAFVKSEMEELQKPGRHTL